MFLHPEVSVKLSKDNVALHNLRVEELNFYQFLWDTHIDFLAYQQYPYEVAERMFGTWKAKKAGEKVRADMQKP